METRHHVSENNYLLIGKPLGDCLRLQALEEKSPLKGSSTNASHRDYYLTLTVGAFHGEFPLEYLRDDLVAFYEQLQILYEQVSQGRMAASAMFHSYDGKLSVQIDVENDGQVLVLGEALDSPPPAANQLAFQFTLDPTYLPSTLFQLGLLIQNWPAETVINLH
jgi:hypothetical protein